MRLILHHLSQPDVITQCHLSLTSVSLLLFENKTNSLPACVCDGNRMDQFYKLLFFFFASQMEPTGPTQHPTARTPCWTPWWKVLTTMPTLCLTWATTLIHCQTSATPRTWWTATSWPGLTPTCRIGEIDFYRTLDLPVHSKSNIHINGNTILKILSCALLQLYSDRTCIVIGLYCLKQHYDWPVELLKV